jgi:hypothetical protein
MKRLNALLSSIIGPAALGYACASFFSQPQSPRAGSASPARADPLSAHSSPGALSPSVRAATAQPVAKAPESVSDRIARLGRFDRVEDLLAELNTLAPGPDRNQALRALGSSWFRLDHAATRDWIASLPTDAEREIAYSGLVESWTYEDSAEASAWIAALPDGPLRWRAGAALAGNLRQTDVGTSLRWAIASRQDKGAASALDSMAFAFGQLDYEEAQQVVTASDLSADEKNQLLLATKKGWNQWKRYCGEWNDLIKIEPTPP